MRILRRQQNTTPFYKTFNMTADYLIAVDAGGTKTRALAYRADDFTPISESETRAGTGNLADSPEDAVRSILDGVTLCS